MKKSHFMWLAVPVSLYLPWMIPGCAGTLTPEEQAELLAGGTTSTGTTGTGPQPAGVVALNKSCTSTDGSCHGPPAIMGLDLTFAGIKAAHDGADFVSKPPSEDVTNGAACSPKSEIPITGKLIVDPANPEASLLYAKMAAAPECGSHMPVLPRKGQPAQVSKADQQSILDWIKTLPKVGAGTGAGAGAGGSSGTAGSGGGSAGGSGGSGGSGSGTGGSGGSGPTDAGKG